MAELFKERYNYELLYKLGEELKEGYKAFPADDFLHSTMDET